MEELRLECLRLALRDTHYPADVAVRDAQRFLDFVTGKDRASAVDAAKGAIDALR